MSNLSFANLLSFDAKRARTHSGIMKVVYCSELPRGDRPVQRLKA